MNDLLVRFLVGGAMVSFFSALGEVFKPRSFAGIFGAAPSVALATLALAFISQGPPYVAQSARAMIAGAVAMLVYSGLTVVLCRQEQIPVWLTAASCWLVWLLVAVVGWRVSYAAGLLP